MVHQQQQTNIAERLYQLSIHREILSCKYLYMERFMFVGDKVDVGSKRRHYMIDKQNQDLHLFHAIAVCNFFLSIQRLSESLISFREY